MLHSAQPFETVCWWDPAIDLASAATDLEGFMRSRRMADLAMRSGVDPMVFVLRPITRRTAICYVRRGATDDEIRMLAFQASVIEVRNARLEDGRTEARWRPRRRSDMTEPQQELLAEIVSGDELEQFDPATILEIGEVARTRAFLPRGTVPLYRLPPSSVQLARNLDSLRADAGSSTAPVAASSSPAEAESPKSSG